MKPAYNEEAVEAAKEQTTGNRLKFKLEFMMMMLHCDRTRRGWQDVRPADRRVRQTCIKHL